MARKLGLAWFGTDTGTLVDIQPYPLAGVVSPSLLGTTGKVPLIIVGSLHDVVRHWSNIIARAREEVLFATNAWSASGASHYITDALIELSKRAGTRGERVVVKLLYDRGNVANVSSTYSSL